ncbi:MAG: hypothetical protein GY703_14115 [Gammaproteobacteria bacterium]|nr:hypothetical protein [Gammaproteobacteria bacterium]
MTRDILAIKVSTANQRDASQELGRQINEAISRLDTLINETRALKIVKRKPALRHQPRPALRAMESEAKARSPR